MLYFLDPVLSSRAETPPPEEFIAIENGRAIAQKPPDRTRHRISKPELVAPDTATLTPGERGFLEELQLGPEPESKSRHAEESSRARRIYRFPPELRFFLQE